MLWSDQVASEEERVSSTRMFINMFLLPSSDTEVADAVVAARLPYDRVSINGSREFTFLSNDVVRTLYVCVQFALLGMCYSRGLKTITPSHDFFSRLTQGLGYRMHIYIWCPTSVLV